MGLKRTGTAVWQGTGLEGKGEVSTPSGALTAQPYSFTTRFVSEDGRAGTNPEELLGASHAACFAMALSFRLAGAGKPAERLTVDAVVSMDKEGVHWHVSGIELKLDAVVPGMDRAQLEELAIGAKETCPISKALAAVPITLTIL